MSNLTNKKGILVNYCNLHNVYNSSLNKKFTKNFPTLKSHIAIQPSLGDIEFIKIDDDVTIANCYVKLNPDANISHSAVTKCFCELSELSNVHYERNEDIQYIISDMMGDEPVEEEYGSILDGYEINKDGITGCSFG
jgi:hypothetical protein